MICTCYLKHILVYGIINISTMTKSEAMEENMKKSKVVFIIWIAVVLALVTVLVFALKKPQQEHNHEVVIDVAVAPTCTETGLTEGKHCSVCGEVLLKQETVAAKGHEIVIDAYVAPTCTKIGLTEGKHCSVCGKVLLEQEIVAANGHEIVIDAAVAPTCTKTGLTEGKHCSVCGKVLLEQEIIAAKGHNMADGVCRICGYNENKLVYTLNSDKKSYCVSGIGTFTGTNLIIPSVYNNMPVTSIDKGAFYGCKSLISITIPDGVTRIDDRAFAFCSSLTSITIPGSVTSIGNYAFYGCSELTGITMPYGVKSIGNETFYDCTSLISVTIPDSVTSIDGGAFNHCPIETATIPALAVKYIKNSELKTVVITSGFSIDEGAFSGCSKLTSITIPDTMTNIGECAFENCTSLISITIPDSVTSIGRYAFCGTAYYNSEDNWADGVLYIGNHLIAANPDKLAANYIVKTGTRCIAANAFYGCDKLTAITIPNSVTGICRWAFWYCASLETITFKGTEGQWNAIAKGTSWDYNAGSRTSGGSYKLVFEK